MAKIGSGTNNKRTLSSSGSTLLEYAIAVALITLLALAGIRSSGNSTNKVFRCVGDNFSGVQCDNAGAQGS